MNHFITLSLSSHYDKSRRCALRERACAALAAGTPGEVGVFDDASDLTVVRGTAAANIAERHRDGRFMLHLGGSVADNRQRRQLSPAELANMWFEEDARALDFMAAPFALCGRRRLHTHSRISTILASSASSPGSSRSSCPGSTPI